MNLLHWHNLRNLPLIKPCSASVTSGDCIILSGASGSGKSLLWRALAGIDPCECDALQYCSTSYADMSPSEWRQSVCYIGQHALFSDGNTRDALEEPFTFRAHRDQSFNPQQIDDWLAALGKPKTLFDQPISALSGGERQIIHILRSLQFSPSVILLDEPTAALDHEAALAFETLIQQWLKAAPQRAVLWISHDDGQISRIATRRWTMHDHQLTTDEPQP
ncbi:ATP-binding cassette domain-containing protein [Cardiobacteriaceae bacterium TAE3-ERU3]|nr:ATP-binding cassette domain-containing protein [Cardiobacteriaceae bacterium TAE3-ERU3]